MVEQKIEFRKIRDFGENINDTFLFIRVNFKPLLTSFFAICAIFMLLHSILQGVIQARYAFVWENLFQRTFRGNMSRPDIFDLRYFVTLFASMFTSMLTYIAMQVTINVYIKFYVENNGQKPGIEEVWSGFKKYFLKIFLFSIPVWLSIAVGFVVCLVPGVYLGVVLIPFITVAIMEDTGFSETFSRCFELVKDRFWTSLGIYVVIMIIYYLSASIVGVVVSGIFGLGSYLTTKNIGTTMVVATSFFSIFTLSFYIIFVISVALNYFTLTEIKDGSGILNRISDLGKNKTDKGDIEEQY